MKSITSLLVAAVLALGTTDAHAQRAQNQLGSQQRTQLLRSSPGGNGAVLYNRAQLRGNGGNKVHGSAMRRTLLMRHGAGRAIIPGPRRSRANVPTTFGSVRRTALVNRDPKLQRLRRPVTTAAMRARILAHRRR